MFSMQLYLSYILTSSCPADFAITESQGCDMAVIHSIFSILIRLIIAETHGYDQKIFQGATLSMGRANLARTSIIGLKPIHIKGSSYCQVIFQNVNIAIENIISNHQKVSIAY